MYPAGLTGSPSRTRLRAAFPRRTDFGTYDCELVDDAMRAMPSLAQNLYVEGDVGPHPTGDPSGKYLGSVCLTSVSPTK